MRKRSKQIKVIPDVSSIHSDQLDNSRHDIELERTKYDPIANREYHFSSMAAVSGEQLVQDLIKKLIATTLKMAAQNALLRKIPTYVCDSSLDLIRYPLIVNFMKPEDAHADVVTGGLEEDEEPSPIFKEQWLTTLVNVQTKIPDRLETSQTNRHSSSTLTFMKSKVFQSPLPGSKSHHRKQDAQPIDLNEPADISFTEEQMRNQKEEQMKEKEQLREAENKRRLKEQKEEQLKYEMIAKDKKSKQFTYDYDGKLIPVVTNKNHKLPPPANIVNSQFQEDATKLPQKKTKFVPQGSPMKKRGEENAADQIKFQALAPSAVDNMNLQQGVNLIVEGRLREGPRPQTVDFDNLTNTTVRMARQEYLGLAQIQNANKSVTVLAKAEDKPIRDLEPKLITMDRLKRLSQPMFSKQQGAIVINSTKIMEHITNVILEEDDLPPINKPSMMASKIEQLRSPTDQFNISLYKNNTWGKDNTSLNPNNTDKLKIKKIKERDISRSLGQMAKQPRNRAIPDKLPKVN